MSFPILSGILQNKAIHPLWKVFEQIMCEKSFFTLYNHSVKICCCWVSRSSSHCFFQKHRRSQKLSTVQLRIQPKCLHFTFGKGMLLNVPFDFQNQTVLSAKGSGVDIFSENFSSKISNVMFTCEGQHTGLLGQYSFTKRYTVSFRI